MSRRPGIGGLVLFGALLAAAALPGCATPSAGGDAEDPAVGRIIVAGEAVPVAARVLSFLDEGGFDARLETCWFDRSRQRPRDPAPGCDGPRRYGRRPTEDLSPETARDVAERGWSRETLGERITQFIVHYDVCVTSARCFRVLHDVRGLSVHFLLDVDGTIYQTLDLEHRARHAGAANDRSIGIEIAHAGAYPPGDDTWRRYYAEDEEGLRLEIPEAFSPPAGVFRPARPGVFRGVINGVETEMPDFTEEQYRALEALIDALVGVFPLLEREVPRDAEGRMVFDELTPEALRAQRGLLGHHHVTRRKIDPGPAFDWERLLRPRP